MLLFRFLPVLHPCLAVDDSAFLAYEVGEEMVSLGGILILGSRYGYEHRFFLFKVEMFGDGLGHDFCCQHGSRLVSVLEADDELADDLLFRCQFRCLLDFCGVVIQDGNLLHRFVFVYLFHLFFLYTAVCKGSE